MPLRGEISAVPFPRIPGRADQSVWTSISRLTRSRDFISVFVFSLIGLFASVGLALQFPDPGPMAALLATF